MKYLMKVLNYYLLVYIGWWKKMNCCMARSNDFCYLHFWLYSISKQQTLYATNMVCKLLKLSCLWFKIVLPWWLSIWYQWGTYTLGLLSCYKKKKSNTIKQKLRKSQSGKDKAKTWKMAAALLFHQDSHKTTPWNISNNPPCN